MSRLGDMHEQLVVELYVRDTMNMHHAPTSRTLNHAPGSSVDTRLHGYGLLLARGT